MSLCPLDFHVHSARVSSKVHRAECRVSPSPAWICVPKCSMDLQSAQHALLADGLAWVCRGEGCIQGRVCSAFHSLAPAPACCSPFTAHLRRGFRDLLPGTKQLPFGYSHLASGEAGAMQVPSALPKTAEDPLAVGFQLQSALAVGERSYVSQGRRAPRWISSRGQREWGAGVQDPTGVQECRATDVWEPSASASGETEGLPKPDTSFSLPPACSWLPTKK